MSFTKACALVLDLAWFPLAAIATVYSAVVKSVDPVRPEVGHPAILLLHGSGGNHGTLAMGVHRLHKRFPNCVYTIQYDGIWKTDRTKSIDQYVQVLKQKCLDIQRRTQQNQIYLVGHSLGGLIAARFAQSCAAEIHIEVPAVVTLGSPWRGSHLINKLWSPGQAWTSRHEDMRPDSPFVRSLNRNLPHHVTRFYCVGSLSDLLVPFEQAIPHGRSEDHKDNLCLNGIGHYTLIVYPMVWEHVEEVLNRHMPRPLSADAIESEPLSADAIYPSLSPLLESVVLVTDNTPELQLQPVLES